MSASPLSATSVPRGRPCGPRPGLSLASLLHWSFAHARHLTDQSEEPISKGRIQLHVFRQCGEGGRDAGQEKGADDDKRGLKTSIFCLSVFVTYMKYACSGAVRPSIQKCHFQIEI